MAKKKKTTGLKDLLGDDLDASALPPVPKQLAPEKVTQITEAVHGRNQKRIGRPPKGESTTKFTTNIDTKLLKTMKKHCAGEVTVRDFLEELIRERLGI